MPSSTVISDFKGFFLFIICHFLFIFVITYSLKISGTFLLFTGYIEFMFIQYLVSFILSTTFVITHVCCYEAESSHLLFLMIMCFFPCPVIGQFRPCRLCNNLLATNSYCLITVR